MRTDFLGVKGTNEAVAFTPKRGLAEITIWIWRMVELATPEMTHDGRLALLDNLLFIGSVPEEVLERLRRRHTTAFRTTHHQNIARYVESEYQGEYCTTALAMTHSLLKFLIRRLREGTKDEHERHAWNVAVEIYRTVYEMKDGRVSFMVLKDRRPIESVAKRLKIESVQHLILPSAGANHVSAHISPKVSARFVDTAVRSGSGIRADADETIAEITRRCVSCPT